MNPMPRSLAFCCAALLGLSAGTAVSAIPPLHSSETLITHGHKGNQGDKRNKANQGNQGNKGRKDSNGVRDHGRGEGRNGAGQGKGQGRKNK